MKKKFDIKFSPDADEQLLDFSKYVQVILLDNIEEQLSFLPTEETKKRKRLGPNPLASWELRIKDYRVFYDVDEELKKVKIIAIGIKKHNRINIGRREFII